MKTKLTFLALVAALAACGGSSNGSALPRGSEPVELDPDEFSAEIDNPYWPMRPGSRWVYRETGENGADKRVVVTVLDRTKTVEGVEARVVHDVVTEEGKLVEDTYDWYSQDAEGSVWYVGEATKEYDEGRLVGTEGSWEAGVDGAQAGIVMPAKPEVGMEYRQEHYEGEAEDAGKVLSLDEWLEVPAGKYRDVLMTKDWTPLEPDVLEHKFYAKGVGPVLALSLSGSGGREELVSVRR
jgi:hypothetical protein